jgi:hypothetical protein
MAVVAGVIGCIKVFYPDFPEDALYAIVIFSGVGRSFLTKNLDKEVVIW